MISLCALWVASRPATQAMPFGWYRAEVLGALSSVLLIWVVTGVLLYLAVERIRNMAYTIDANIMVITSIIGLCVNVVWVVFVKTQRYVRISKVCPTNFKCPSCPSYYKTLRILNVIGEFYSLENFTLRGRVKFRKIKLTTVIGKRYYIVIIFTSGGTILRC